MSSIQMRMKLVVLAFVSCLALSGWSGSRDLSAQSTSSGRSLGTKLVYTDKQRKLDPVVITRIVIGEQQIEPGISTAAREDEPAAPFQADEDWLKNMSISLKNRTDREIVRVDLTLYFPDTGNGSAANPVTTYAIHIGQVPDVDAYDRNGQKRPRDPIEKPLLWAPGKILVIRVGDYIGGIQSNVEQTVRFSQVTRLAIRRFRFYFADGMRWDDLSGFAVPDPKHHGQFTILDRARFFPGDHSQNWPPGE